MNQLGFQRAQVLWSCPRKEGSQGRTADGRTGREKHNSFAVRFKFREAEIKP